jgi:cytochrome c oxidase subunit 1
MHIAGMQGQPRRTATYPEGMGWDLMNLLSTVGAFTIAAGFLVFIYNVVRSRRNVTVDPDPWDARTIEWATSSPPPVHNFDVEPTVTQLDEYWHRKYEVGLDHKLRRRETVETFIAETPPQHVHLPSPSYWPIVLAFGLPLLGYGLMYTYWLTAVGALVILVSIFGWALEPSVDPDAGHDTDDHYGPGPDEEPGAVAEPEPALVGAAGSTEDDA